MSQIYSHKSPELLRKHLPASNNFRVLSNESDLTITEDKEVKCVHGKVVEINESSTEICLCDDGYTDSPIEDPNLPYVIKCDKPVASEQISQNYLNYSDPESVKALAETKSTGTSRPFTWYLIAGLAGVIIILLIVLCIGCKKFRKRSKNRVVVVRR